jgi:hypothetical protein
MKLEEIQSLVNRLDDIGIMNPATYQLGLNDDPNKRRFMDDYTRQMQWITDAYALFKSLEEGQLHRMNEERNAKK